MVDNNILEYLLKLGISEESAKVYMCLVGKNAQTAQEISKKTHIPKTTIYRRIEELKKVGLVEEQVEEYKKVFTITSVDLLNLLIVKKEQEVKDLRAELPHIRHLLLGQFQSFDPETKVLFYRGQEGIQQMLWNILRAKTPIVGYSYRDLTKFTGKNFSETWIKEFQANNISGRDIFSDEFIKSKFEEQNLEGWQVYPESQSRYISPKILDINHQMDVYNNIVAIYNWHKGDIFGIEIYNEKVANFHRQMFEVLWEKGEQFDFSQQEKRYKEITKNK